MLKKLALVGVAGLMGLFFMAGSSYAKNVYDGHPGGQPSCQGDDCMVPNPIQATIGVDLKLDFDVCLELPEDLCSYKGCEQAIIVQTGHMNYGEITQSGANFALIYQTGNWDYANIEQYAESGAMALVFQKGNWNFADVTQNTAASALVYQDGCGNYGIISQY